MNRPWYTAMHEAFLAATVKRSTGAAIINSCAKALRHNAEGMRMGKGWNAHLSFKTAEKLKAEGILA